MIDFLIRLGQTVSEINRLLKMRFVLDHPNTDTPIGQSLVQILQLHNSGNLEHRNYELIKLAYLVRNLNEIENYDPQLLTHFRRAIRKSGSTDSYYGFRFEIATAASLTQNGILFRKNEKPDFILTDAGVSIECSSVRVRSGRQKDNYSYKITSCINAKQEKKYAISTTTLFIDATNILRQTLTVDKERIRDTIESAMNENSFGSVLIFFYLYDKTINGYGKKYIRHDHPNISHKLKTFLDVYYPFGEDHVTDYSVPTEG